MKRLAVITAALLASTPAQADPLSIGVAFLVNIGWTGAITGIGATLVGGAILGLGAIGLSLAASLLTARPNGAAPQAKPSERQSTIRQAVGPRVRFHGRNKVGGTLWFFDVSGTKLYVGITLNEGEISRIVEVWLNDQRVTLSNDSYVNEAPYVPSGEPVAQIIYKLGIDDQLVHPELDAAFSSVNASHRLRGVANCLAIFREVYPELISTVYPNYIPNVRTVADMSLVKSVRTGQRVYSDNAGDVIYDYLTGVDGAGFPYGPGYREDQIDLDSFQRFADLSDELVPLKGGGEVRRYRLWGGYALNEEMRSVLPRMLSACDADIFMNKQGKLAIRGGQWVEPVLVLDSQAGHIISGEFRRGQSSLAAFNELTITYTEPTQDYQEAEAEPWVDEDNVALRGRAMEAQINITYAPNHSQARRVGKIYSKKRNPKWAGKIITNFYGMNAVDEETVRIKFHPLGIDEDFMITSLRFLDNLSGVEMDVSSLSADAYEWNAEMEEGNGPSIPPDTRDPVAPGPITGLTNEPGVGTISLLWSQPTSPNVSSARVYRSTINDFSSASRVGSRFGGPSAGMEYSEAVAAGTYYYWVTAANGSGVESSPVATGSVVVS